MIGLDLPWDSEMIRVSKTKGKNETDQAGLMVKVIDKDSGE